MNKISALSESWESSLLSALCEDTVRSWWPVTQKRALTTAWPRWYHDPRYPASTAVRSHFLLEVRLHLCPLLEQSEQRQILQFPFSAHSEATGEEWWWPMLLWERPEGELRDVNGMKISPVVQAHGLWRDKAVRKPWPTWGQEEGAGRWEHPLSAPDMCLKANQKSSLSHERQRIMSDTRKSVSEKKPGKYPYSDRA